MNINKLIEGQREELERAILPKMREIDKVYVAMLKKVFGKNTLPQMTPSDRGFNECIEETKKNIEKYFKTKSPTYKTLKNN